MLFKSNEVILFQGDSVTDCGRHRDNYYHLGDGYVQQIQNYLTKHHASLNLKLINRAVGGDLLRNMQDRLTEDCLVLNPDWVCILIGINDTWRHYSGVETTSAQQFENMYRNVLTQIKAQTEANLILCEPFVLPVTADQEAWFDDLNPKVDVIKKLVNEFEAIYVPYGDVFKVSLDRNQAAYYAADGVHPTPTGHKLMAKTWLQTLEVK